MEEGDLSIMKLGKGFEAHTLNEIQTTQQWMYYNRAHGNMDKQHFKILQLCTLGRVPVTAVCAYMGCYRPPETTRRACSGLCSDRT